MLSRCFNPNVKCFKSYGGRGITVCDEWRDDFTAFYNYVSKFEHFGEEGYSLDRIDNDGNYEPGNVRRATRLEQSQNRKRVHHIELNGVEMTVAEIAEIAGVHRSTIHERIKRGWTGDDLLKPAQR